MNAKKPMVTTSSKAELIAKLVEKLGFPIVLTAVMIVMFCYAASWSAENLLKPITAAHLETLRIVREDSSKQTKQMEQIFALFVTSDKEAKYRTELLENLNNEQKRTTAAVEDLKKKM